MKNFPYLQETDELTETVRSKAGGSFIQLTDGVCHYELSTPPAETGRVAAGSPPGTVVLIHGFSVPSYIWDPTFEFLGQSGYRVLRYDLFGRGYSDRPRLPYTIDLFVRQLADLLDKLQLTQPLDIAGLSMGGPISAAFIHRYPNRVRKHLLVDPAGARSVHLSWMLHAAKVPLIPELVLGLFGSGHLVKSIASDFFSPDLIEQFQEKYRVQMQYKGFLHAILSTVRNGMLDSFIETYRLVGELKKPSLLIWGCNDTTVPFEESRDLLSAIPHAEFHAIADSGHIPHYEKAGEVNPILSRFLSSGD
jgi:pimeloyl-ACP methyl ester carboxylesterase